MIKRLVHFCTIFLICTLACKAQTQHDRIDARGQVKTDRFVNRLFIVITGATPDVSNGNAFKTNNGGAVTITNFLNGVDTQEVDVLCGDGNTTVQNNANIVLSAGVNFSCTANVGISFRYDAAQSKWVQFGGTGSGGGGGTPAAPEGAIQRKTGAGFGASNIVESGTNLNVDDNVNFKGPNPYIDGTRFGMRAVNQSVVPAIPGITFSSTNGSPNVTISAASTFQNGDGVALHGAGSDTIGVPAAPTLIPSLAAGPTGTLLYVNGPAGATTYCYQLVARSLLGAINVSPETCTTTGPTSLGLQSCTITSATLVLNVATYTTSAPCGLVPGAYAVITNVAVNVVSGQATGAFGYPNGGLTAPNPFTGRFLINTTPDTTHFTVSLNSDTRNGAIATGTGGTVNYWNSIHITGTELTNNFQFYVYGRVSGGTKTLIGTTWPQNAGLLENDGSSRLSDPTYLALDDFGSTVTTFPNPPPYIPTVVPTAAANGMLATTIVSGAGTTSLVLANNAGKTISGQTILFDDAITFKAAVTYATNVAGGTTGPLMIPWSGAGTYVFNSPVTYTAATSLAVLNKGGMWMNEPLTAANVSIYGEPSSSNTNPSFSNFFAPTITFDKASPGIYATGNNYFWFLNFSQVNTNGATMFVQDFGGVPSAGGFREVNFQLGTGTSYSNMAAMFRGGGAGYEFTNTALLASQNNTLTANTPGIYFNNTGNSVFKTLSLGGIGVAARVPSTGMYMIAENVYCQGCYQPFFTAIGNANTPLVLATRNSTFDTTNVPFLANLGATTTLYSEVSLFPPSITGTGSLNLLLSGLPLGSVGTPININHSTTNTSFGVADGTFGRVARFPVDVYNRSVTVGQGYSLFTTTGPYAAPTSCVVSAGGAVPVGTFYYYYAPIFPNGSEGTLSQFCTATTTTGNQTVTLNWASVAGVTQYTVYRGTSQSNVVKLDNSNITGTSYADVLSIPSGASVPQLAGGGPAGLRGSLLWGQTAQIGLTSHTSAATVSRSIVDPDLAGTAALVNAAQTWSGTQTGMTLATPALTNGTSTSLALTTPTLGGETITSSPRGPLHVLLPGALTTTWTGETWTLDKAITVTRVQAQARTAPSGCGTSAIVRLSDGTTNVNLTIAAAANDSGAITQNYAAGAVLTLAVQTAAATCTTSPGDANVVVQYKMQ